MGPIFEMKTHDLTLWNSKSKIKIKVLINQNVWLKKKLVWAREKNTCKHMETKVAEAIAKWGNWNIIGVKCIFKEI